MFDVRAKKPMRRHIRAKTRLTSGCIGGPGSEGDNRVPVLGGCACDIRLSSNKRGVNHGLTSKSSAWRTESVLRRTVFKN